MIRIPLTVLLVLLLELPLTYPRAITVAMIARAQESRRSKALGRHFRVVEPDLYSPDLYADTLKVQFTLVDLPGASKVGSKWEVSYRVYFIPEDKYWKAVGSQPSISEPAQFPEKILLAEGKFSRVRLATMSERTYIRDRIAFKSKIPQKHQTKFAMLMTSYSIKIYDARLKAPVYNSSLFLTEPFTDDLDQPDKAVPRTTLYTNFLLTPAGQFFTSQWPRKTNDTRWAP